MSAHRMRSTRRSRLSLAFLTVVLALACKPPPSAVPLFDLAHAGPFVVGVDTVTYLDASRGRSLVTEIWYPATGGGEAEAPLGLSANTFRGATPATGRFPLVLFSHAMESIRLQSYSLCARLASEGFVVVAPNHPGTTYSDFEPSNLVPALTQQPRDLSFLLDVLPADPLVGASADFSQVAAIGHSLGAYTVLAAAAGHARNGVVRDDRIRAAVALDAPLFKEPLAALPPTLMVSGTRDTVTPPPNQVANYTDAPGPKMLLTFQGGSHLAPASNWCSIASTPECRPPYLTGQDQYEALNELTVDFLRFVLDGDQAARGRLLAGETSFGGILTSESQGV